MAPDGADLLVDPGFDVALVGSDLVVTGERPLDLQTVSGKAPLDDATYALLDPTTTPARRPA